MNGRIHVSLASVLMISFTSEAAVLGKGLHEEIVGLGIPHDLIEFHDLGLTRFTPRK